MYNYCYGTVFTIITITMVLYAQLYYDIVCMQNYDIMPLERFCEVLYIKLCIGHAKIFINLPPGNHENIFGFSAFHVGLPPKPTGYRCLANGLLIRTDCTNVLVWIFEFVRFLPVTAAYQSVYRNWWPVVQWTSSVMKTLHTGVTLRRWFLSPPLPH
jgi:hypothetical protein